MASPFLYLDSKLANSLYKLHQQNLPQVLIHMAVHNTAFPYKWLKDCKQRCTRGYKQYKETSGLIEWKECQIFHSIFT